jgi:endoglucanase
MELVCQPHLLEQIIGRNEKSPFSCLIIFLFIQSVTAQTETDAIRLSQIGFYPNGPKLAIVVDATSTQFYVTTPDLGDTVFTGNLSSAKVWAPSQESVKQADFSGLTTIGTFCVLVPEIGYSSTFDIKPRVYQEVARAASKAFYFQRASLELTEPFAGKWERPLGHPDNQIIVHASAASAARPAETIIACPRGWYDAGDYNKYIVNSGISTYTLLSLYEHFPKYGTVLEHNIPESNNGVPDILDEALWNIQWMLTMQDPDDGGIYHKCTEANFSGMVMPHQVNVPRYVVQKSTPAALDFAAVMAQASRIFSSFESALMGIADTFLNAALNAWKWARSHPNTFYRQSQVNQQYNPDINTGEYGDSNVSDEFKWAAAELYITTQQDSFISIVNPFSDSYTSVPGWQSVSTLGFYSLAHYRKQLTSKVDTTALKNRVIGLANQLKNEFSTSAYGVTIRDFWWGSNSLAANQGIALIQAFELTADSSYLQAAIANLDYLLGRNATAYSFVTGYGSKPPMHPHHRPSEADGIKEPIPGLLVGGPNPGQQDNVPNYPSNLPAKSYIDVMESYASNEICINWNAPLVYLAAAIEAIKSSTGKPITITVAITTPDDEAPFTTADVIPIQSTASISEGNIIGVEFFANDIKIGAANTAPYKFNWTPIRAGVYKLKAKAIGDQGDFQLSSPVTIIVSNATTVGNILLVVGSPALNDGERAIRDFLITNDYHIKIQDDADSTAFDVAEKDVILISGTVSSPTKIRAELTNIPVPMVGWEMTLFDDFGWTGRRSNVDCGRVSGTMIDIKDESHPLAADLSGSIQVTHTAMDLTWGVPNENARIIATVKDDTSKATIFAYETGDKMY